MKMTATLGILVLASLAGAAVSSGVPGDADCTGAEFLQGRPEDFSTLLTLIGTAADKALDTFYNGATNSSIVYTFFAPTNQAFENIFNALGANIDAASRSENLDPVLRYHLVPGVAALAKDIEYGTVLPTAHPALPGYFDSNTVTADLLVFGPYVEGSLVPTASVGPVKVVESDIQCGGGIIHVIDNVMIPTFPDPEEDFGCDPRNFLSSGYLPGLSITSEILQYDSGNFPEFYSGAGNATAEYTFFVPSDAAWESAFQFFNFSVSDIFAEDNDQADLENINNVLFNHFTGGTFDYATLSTFTGELPTATGFTPHGTNDTLTVTDGVLSAVVPYQPVGFPYTDIEFCGGVLHVVDTVLVPNFPNPPQGPAPDDDDA